MPEATPPPHSPPPPTGAATGMGDTDDHIVERRSLRDYYIILRERLWIALPLALLVAVSVGYYQSRETPMYSTSATMEFVTKRQRITNNAAVVDTMVQSDVDFNNYISRLRSGELRQRVVASFNGNPTEMKILRRAYEKNLPPGENPPSLDGTVTGWSVTPQKGGTFLSISVSHMDPEAAALIANRVVTEFTKVLENEKSGMDVNAKENLVKNIEDARLKAEEAQRKLNDFARANNLGASLTAAQDLASSKQKLEQDNVNRAEAAVRSFQAPLTQIEQFRRERKDLLLIEEIKRDTDVIRTKDALAAATARFDLLSETYGPRWPEMITAADQLDTAQKAYSSALAHAEEVLRSSLDNAQRALNQAKTRLDQAAQDVVALGPKTIEYLNLESALKVARDTYADLLKRKQEVDVVSSTEQTPVIARDKAGVPGRPYAPDLNRITRTCIGIGVLVFVGVAVGLSFIDDRIKSAWDVEHYIGVNLLGIIPDLSSLKDEEKYTMVLNNRQAPGSESFLSVYSAVKIHSKLDFPKSILITSTIPGEGKTLISSNLAGSFARHGKRTLLIDCDLRRPMMHRHFKQQNNTGLITWFENGANIEGNLPEDPTLGIIKVGEGLSLLCSGGRSKSPTEILESKAFADLLSRLKRFYDLVVVDSPPLGAVTDSLLIAQRTDEVIYVCRFNRAYKKHIRLYVKALRSARNEVLGIVLNGLTPRRIEYYSNYRYYRSYKKYYGSQT